MEINEETKNKVTPLLTYYKSNHRCLVSVMVLTVLKVLAT